MNHSPFEPISHDHKIKKRLSEEALCQIEYQESLGKDSSIFCKIFFGLQDEGEEILTAELLHEIEEEKSFSISKDQKFFLANVVDFIRRKKNVARYG